jgi:hypothetical protein
VVISIQAEPNHFIISLTFKNKPPIAEYHQIDTSSHSVDEAAQKWQNEILSVNDQSTGHKIIAAPASDMVPFGTKKKKFLFYLQKYEN